MKRSGKTPKGTIKGTPSAVLLSVLIHVGLFLLAGMLVVFTVVTKEEQVFEPPKAVERPKIKLKKPKVRVKKSSKPKSTTRIVTKSNRSSMPNIQLPGLSGLGDGLDGGIGGFDNMPDLGDINVLGSSQSIGNDLVGVYYDLKFTKDGRWNPLTEDEWRYQFHKFFREDWDPKIFSRFYRSPNKLYTTFLVFPLSISAMAPVAFGVSDKMASGGEWIIHYQGKLVHKEGITFRFWVSVDDSLAIRVDNEVVIAASFISMRDGLSKRSPLMYQGLWESSSMDTGKYQIGQALATVGDWVTLEPGVAKDIEVVVTDNVGANASFFVMVEEKGVEYPRSRHNGPLLPVFKTETLTHDQLDLIYRGIADEEIDFVNGPVFRDY
jgi:hypothetical protein